MNQEEKEKYIKAFELLPTGNISDAMDALHLNRGFVKGVHPVATISKRTAGFAFTIKQIRRRMPYNGKNLAKQGNLIDEVAETGDIVVIDMADIREVCTGGSILALRAKMKGIKGELTNGCVRDAKEIGALDFPLWCSGTCPVKSALDIETIGYDVPVYIGGIQIHPEDLIVMDETGVIAVPSEHLDEVLAKAQAIAKREGKMIALIREGKTLAEARKIK